MRHRHGGRVINIARWFVGRSMLGILIWRRLWVHLIATQPHPEYCWNYECRPLWRTRSTVDYRQSKPGSTRAILSNFSISIWLLTHGSSQVPQQQWILKQMTRTERVFHLFFICTMNPKQLIGSLHYCVQPRSEQGWVNMVNDPQGWRPVYQPAIPFPVFTF